MHRLCHGISGEEIQSADPDSVLLSGYPPGHRERTGNPRGLCGGHRFRQMHHPSRAEGNTRHSSFTQCDTLMRTQQDLTDVEVTTVRVFYTEAFCKDDNEQRYKIKSQEGAHHVLFTTSRPGRDTLARWKGETTTL